MHFNLANIGPLKQIFSSKLKSNSPYTFTFFVTSVCNLRCKYCLNYDVLGKGATDLKFDEIEKLSSNLPETIKGVLFSGGEPLWRGDIVEVCDLFIQKNKFKGFGIPTNAVHEKNTLTKLDKILNHEKRPEVVACVALDVFSETHNSMRGNGTFEKVVKTLENLTHLRKENPNLSILINSVLTKKSIPELIEFVKYVKTLNPNLHTVEVVRDDTNWRKDGKYNDLVHEDFDVIKKARLLIDDLYRKDDILFPLYNIRSKLLTNVQRNVLLYGKKWPSPCSAGIRNFVIQSNGDVSICENQKILGNLRDHNYDPLKIINDLGGQQKLEVEKHNCDCSHIVYLKESLEHSMTSNGIKYFFNKDLSN